MRSNKIVRELLRNSENWILATLGVLGTIFVVQSLNYRFTVALFPRLVNITLACLCFYKLVKNIWETRSGATSNEEEKEEARHGLVWYGSLLLACFYFGAIYVIGFVWATGLFLLTFPVFAGYRRWIIIFAVAFITAILIEVSFHIFLQIPLPKGILFALME